MKRIFGILLMIMVFGMLVSSVSAEELKPYDFGDYTLNVPGDNWHWFNAPYSGSSNGNGVSISHFYGDEFKEARVTDFEDFSKTYFGNYDLIEDEDGLKVYQAGNDYIVAKYSVDELYVIKDKDLNEAKAIAESAQLKSNETVDEDSDKLFTESDAFDNLFKMDIPKKSEFEKINEEGNESYSTVSFKDYNKDIAVNYVESDDMDAVKEHISEMIGLNDGNLTEEGNLTIAETVYGENSVYVFSDNKAVEVSSSKVDLDILKEMAKSVEFED